MKNKMTKKLLSALLALAMLLSLVPAASLTASAVSVAEEWTTDITVTETRTINGNVLVNSDITLTIAEGVTLTVNGRVIASGMTLTADGGGTLVVNGVNGPNGTDHNPVGGVYNGTAGYSGGPGISGNIYVAGASVVVNGGNGGNGGSSETDGAAGGNGGNAIDGAVTLESGSITATGGKGGSGGVILMGGSGANGSDGKAVTGSITVTGTGATVQESDNNIEWIYVSGTTSDKQYVKVAPAHTHNFTYSADGATITAVCSEEECPLEDLTATLTIVAPTLTTYGQTGEGISAEATITDENNIRGAAAVSYYKATKNEEDDTYTKSGDALAAAPADAGDYIAEITLGTGEGAATASVVYAIAKADPTANAPAGATATYGQTLADVTLTNPSGNTAGTWAWVDDTQSVGNVVSPAATFKANFTPTDTNNYNVAENIDVTVTVGKADPTYTVPAGLTAGVNSLLSAVALPDGWSWADGTQNVGDFGDKTFKATFTPEDTDNYNVVSDIDVPVGVRNVPEYDIPDGLTAGYGDTLADVLLPDGWSWDDSTEIVGDLGENVHKATFTPEDTANYLVVSGIDVTVTVGKGTIKNYTKPTAAHIKYPQTLSEATLTGGDTGDIEGVWSWLIPDVQPTSAQSGSSFELIFTPTGDYAELYNPIVTRLAVIVEPAEFEPDSISDANEDITLYGEFAKDVSLELTPITHNQSAYLALLRASSRDASGLRKLVLFKTMALTGAEEAYNGTLTLTSFVGEKRAGETVSAWFFIDGAPVNYVGTVDADGFLVIEGLTL